MLHMWMAEKEMNPSLPKWEDIFSLHAGERLCSFWLVLREKKPPPPLLQMLEKNRKLSFSSYWIWSQCKWIESAVVFSIFYRRDGETFPDVAELKTHLPMANTFVGLSLALPVPEDGQVGCLPEYQLHILALLPLSTPCFPSPVSSLVEF